jgi:hypothetical protein
MDEHVNIGKLNIAIIVTIAISFCFLNYPNNSINQTRILQTVFEKYEFVKNITSTIYEGEWTSHSSSEKKLFENDEGYILFGIEKNTSEVDLLEIKNLKLHFIANDGLYTDRRMFFNITLDLPESFNLTENYVQFKQNNLSIDYQRLEYFDLNSEGQCFNTTIDLKFTKKEKNFIKDFQTVYNILYSKVEGRIYDEDCNFRMYINLESEEDIVL